MWEKLLCENFGLGGRRDMEELRKLEKVQRMLEFMESRGVSNSNHHSNRFLANFIIFMIQPCGDLAINDKCCVLSHFIPTVSPTPSFHFHGSKWNLKIETASFPSWSSHLHSSRTRTSTTISPPPPMNKVLVLHCYAYFIVFMCAFLLVLLFFVCIG